MELNRTTKVKLDDKLRNKIRYKRNQGQAVSTVARSCNVSESTIESVMHRESTNAKQVASMKWV